MNNITNIGIFHYSADSELAAMMAGAINNVESDFNIININLDEKYTGGAFVADWIIIIANQAMRILDSDDIIAIVRKMSSFKSIFIVTVGDIKLDITSRLPIQPINIKGWRGSVKDERFARLVRIVTGPPLKKAGFKVSQPESLNRIGNIQSPIQRQHGTAGHNVLFLDDERHTYFNPYLYKKISDLELSVRTNNALLNDGTKYVGDLIQITEAELLRVPNFGRKSLNEIKEVLRSMDLFLDSNVPGWPPEDIEGQEKRDTLARRIATLKQAPSGATFEAAKDSLVINPAGDEADSIAAGKPVVKQLHIEALRKSKDFCRIAPRVDNQIGWHGIVDLSKQLEFLLDRDILDIPDVLGSIYGKTLELGSFLEMDSNIRSGQESFSDCLSVEIRRPMDDLLRTIAPWLRSFPTIREADDESSQFLTSPNLVAPASEVISAASFVKLLSVTDAQAVKSLLEAAVRGEFQGSKAGHRGILSARNLIVTAAGVIATVMLGAIGSNLAPDSIIATKAANFVASAEPIIIELVSGMPVDIKLVILDIIRESQKNPLNTPQIPNSANSKKPDEEEDEG